MFVFSGENDRMPLMRSCAFARASRFTVSRRRVIVARFYFQTSSEISKRPIAIFLRRPSARATRSRRRSRRTLSTVHMTPVSRARRRCARRVRWRDAPSSAVRQRPGASFDGASSHARLRVPRRADADAAPSGPSRRGVAEKHVRRSGRVDEETVRRVRGNRPNVVSRMQLTVERRVDDRR